MQLCTPIADYVVEMESGQIAQVLPGGRGRSEATSASVEYVSLIEERMESKKEGAEMARILIDKEVSSTVMLRVTIDLSFLQNRLIGNVPLRAYKRYFSAISIGIWLLISLALCASQIVIVSQRLLLKRWGESSHSSTDAFQPLRTPGYWLKLYILTE